MTENNLKKKTVYGVVWSTIQRFGKMGLSLVANIIMARILSPDDYGTMGIIFVFTSIATVFVDSGFGSALIQKQNPTKEDYSTVFFFSLIVAVFLYALLFFAAPFVAVFYRIPSLTALMRILGLILIINSFSIIQNNLLRKQMNFKGLSLITLAAAIIGVVVGIICAVKGQGVWSLVYYPLTEALVFTILVWAVSQWRPVLVFSIQSLKQLFSYGGFLLANSLLFTIRRNAIAMVMGKLYTATDLGYYTQAKKLEDIPVTSIQTIIGQVTFPLFSKINNNIERIKEVQKTSNIVLAFACIPLMVLFIIIAEPLMVLLLSDKWIDGVPYFQILCLCGSFVALQEVNANVVNALGYSKKYFYWSLVKTVILFAFIFVGTIWGIYGLLLGFVFQNIMAYMINAFLSSNYTHYTVGRQLLDLFPIAIISVVVGSLVYLCSYLNLNYLIMMFVQIIIFVLLYFSLFYLIKRDYFNMFVGLIKTI